MPWSHWFTSLPTTIPPYVITLKITISFLLSILSSHAQLHPGPFTCVTAYINALSAVAAFSCPYLSRTHTHTHTHTRFRCPMWSRSKVDSQLSIHPRFCWVRTSTRSSDVVWFHSSHSTNSRRTVCYQPQKEIKPIIILIESIKLKSEH